MSEQQREGDIDDLAKLADPEFFTHWAYLRARVALSGKSVPRDLKRLYDDVSCEYRRRLHIDEHRE